MFSILSRSVLLILSLLLIAGCRSMNYPLRWDSNFMSAENRSTFWNEGSQCLTIEKNGLIITVNGILTRVGSAYLFITIYNDRDEGIEFFPGYTLLNQGEKEYFAVKPSEIRKAADSKSNIMGVLFAATIVANTLAASSSNSLGEKAYYRDQNLIAAAQHGNAMDKINTEEFNQIESLLKNNYLPSQSSYSGYLMFEKIKNDKLVVLKLNVDNTIFELSGKFVRSDVYDEYDLPEHLEKIVFE